MARWKRAPRLAMIGRGDQTAMRPLRPMPLTIEIPKDEDWLDYICSFAPAFARNPRMSAALSGMNDSLRQAALIPTEPLGMFACLTAEEEAAAFLYYVLCDKGYCVPKYGALQRHGDKARVLVLAQSLYQYFFTGWISALSGRLRIERDGVNPSTKLYLDFGEFVLMPQDPLEMIVTHGEGESGHDAAVEESIETVISSLIPRGGSLKSVIHGIANRRSLCLYGAPEKKVRFSSGEELSRYKFNCISIATMGFLVFNGERRTSSMEKLVEGLFRRISSGAQ